MVCGVMRLSYADIVATPSLLVAGSERMERRRYGLMVVVFGQHDCVDCIEAVVVAVVVAVVYGCELPVTIHTAC